MPVVASFTADVQLGAAPLTVTFTDTSTGSPDAWLWDFGDGTEFSEDQHPVHIYAANGSYNVTLTAYILDGAPTTITRTFPGTGLIKSTGINATEALAWAEFGGLSFSSGSAPPEFQYTKSAGADHRYAAVKDNPMQFDLTSVAGNKIVKIVYKFHFRCANSGGPAAGTFTYLIESSGASIGISDVTHDNPAPNPGLGTTEFVVANATTLKGTTFQIPTIGDGNNFSQQLGAASTVIVGVVGYEEAASFAQVQGYTDLNEKIETAFVHVGPPIADFSGTPLSGPSPLSVVFTNLTTGGTTYSWKKRKAGTSDSFVEFSTAVNPTHAFDKTNP